VMMVLLLMAVAMAMTLLLLLDLIRFLSKLSCICLNFGSWCLGLKLCLCWKPQCVVYLGRTYLFYMYGKINHGTDMRNLFCRVTFRTIKSILFLTYTAFGNMRFGGMWYLEMLWADIRN
jgi:hypothetical protein